jgi:DNA-directed RNA polymerase specialized sigma24 family protein
LKSFRHTGDPLDEAVASLDRRLILAAMAQLCAEHRSVILRSYYAGWTTSHIAVDLNTTERVVHSRLHDALRSLLLGVRSRCGGFAAW